MVRQAQKDDLSTLDDLIKTTPRSKKIEDTSKPLPTKKNSNDWLKTENKRLADEVSRLRKELVKKNELLNSNQTKVSTNNVIDSKVENLFLIFYRNHVTGNKYQTIAMTHKPSRQGLLDEFVKAFPFLSKYKF